MKKVFGIMSILIVVSLILSSVPARAANYMTSPPLVEVEKTPVGPVNETGTLELPIITWGGDMATVYANGNSLTTTTDSLFGKEGLNFKLIREDVFVKQLSRYRSGASPYIRGTLGMINQASELLAQDPRTKPIVLYQLTWSAGGDCLVVKGGIKELKDLKGKNIALQVYSPHVELLATILANAGLKLQDVNIKWTKDLTGTAESPAEAMRKDASIDAVFCISPDAAALTSNGNVGTGAEQSVKGAKILFSTKTANRIIPDVYAVRADYFESHRQDVEKFCHALLMGQEGLSHIMQNAATLKADYDKTMAASAKILLDSEQAVADAKGLYGDCEFVGFQGNIKFFATPAYPRRFELLTEEMQKSLIEMGILKSKPGLAQAGFDYEALKKGLTQTNVAEAPKFKKDEVAKVVDEKNKQGTLADGAIYSFEIYFKPNQNTFNANDYKAEFDKVIDLSSTYGGAVITVEGHSDPTGYLKKKGTTGTSEVELQRIRQAAKNLSLTRANAVRESILNYARGKSVTMDPSQFAVIGHGFEHPKTGITKSGEPIAPTNEKEWLSNMRVEFRIIPVEAESSVFTPVGGGQ